MDIVSPGIENASVLEEFESFFDQKYLSFVPDISDDFLDTLSGFFCLSNYEEIALYQAYGVKNDDESERAVLCIFYAIHQVQSSSRGGRSFDAYMFAAAVKYTGWDYGKILIRPELWHDKIQDVWLKTDLDFKHSPLFSKRYHCMASDVAKANTFCSPERLDKIQKYNNLIIEVQEQVMIIRNEKSLNLKDLISMTELSLQI